MRYIAYGLAIFAAVFVIAFTTGYLPRDATASHNENPTTPPFARCERSELARYLFEEQKLNVVLLLWT
jgi:hypothetical protein